MKLSNVTLCLASAAFMLSTSAFAAGDNANGSLHTIGQVLDATCTIASSELNQAITLDPITVASISAVSPGAKVAEKPVDFTLTGCPASLTALGVRFNYDEDAAGHYMKNTGDAEGVLLGISSIHNNDALSTGSVVQSEDYDVDNGGNATVHAKVNAYRIGTAAPVEGVITSISQVVVAYN